MKNDLTNKVKNNPAYKIYELTNQLAILKEYLKYLSKNSLNSEKAIKVQSLEKFINSYYKNSLNDILNEIVISLTSDYKNSLKKVVADYLEEENIYIINLPVELSNFDRSFTEGELEYFGNFSFIVGDSLYYFRGRTLPIANTSFMDTPEDDYYERSRYASLGFNSSDMLDIRAGAIFKLLYERVKDFSIDENLDFKIDELIKELNLEIKTEEDYDKLCNNENDYLYSPLILLAYVGLRNYTNMLFLGDSNYFEKQKAKPKENLDFINWDPSVQNTEALIKNTLWEKTSYIHEILIPVMEGDFEFFHYKKGGESNKYIYYTYYDDIFELVENDELSRIFKVLEIFSEHLKKDDPQKSVNFINLVDLKKIDMYSKHSVYKVVEEFTGIEYKIYLKTTYCSYRESLYLYHIEELDSIVGKFEILVSKDSYKAKEKALNEELSSLKAKDKAKALSEDYERLKNAGTRKLQHYYIMDSNRAHMLQDYGKVYKIIDEKRLEIYNKIIFDQIYKKVLLSLLKFEYQKPSSNAEKFVKDLIEKDLIEIVIRFELPKVKK